MHEREFTGHALDVFRMVQSEYRDLDYPELSERDIAQIAWFAGAWKRDGDPHVMDGAIDFCYRRGAPILYGLTCSLHGAMVARHERDAKRKGPNKKGQTAKKSFRDNATRRAKEEMGKYLFFGASRPRAAELASIYITEQGYPRKASALEKMVSGEGEVKMREWVRKFFEEVVSEDEFEQVKAEWEAAINGDLEAPPKLKGTARGT